MKRLILGSLLVVFCGGIILGYGWKGIEVREALQAKIEQQRSEYWGCHAPEYIGPTGDNHSVEASEWKPYRRPERWWD